LPAGFRTREYNMLTGQGQCSGTLDFGCLKNLQKYAIMAGAFKRQNHGDAGF